MVLTTAATTTTAVTPMPTKRPLVLLLQSMENFARERCRIVCESDWCSDFSNTPFPMFPAMMKKLTAQMMAYSTPNGNAYLPYKYLGKYEGTEITTSSIDIGSCFIYYIIIASP